MRRLEGKTALITGCNRGIGLAILRKFVQEGANIIALTRTLNPEIEKEICELKDIHKVNITRYAVDLLNEGQVRDIMKEVSSKEHKIDILVNNAGVSAGGFMIMTPMQKIHDVFQVNYFSQVLLTQCVAKLMMKQKRGSIVFMSSVLGLDSRAGGSAYGASKAAVAYLTKTLSKELGGFNIRVNAIAPNLIDTDMAHEMEAKSFADMIEATSLKRIGYPEEVAGLAVYLASDEASYITGQIIRIDGGQ